MALALLVHGCVSSNPKPGVYAPSSPDEQVAPARRTVVAHRRIPARPTPQEAPGTYVLASVADEPEAQQIFLPEIESTAQAFAAEEEIRAFSSSSETTYRLGPGDRFAFLVRGRPDISREDVVVAPDGLVSLPRVGVFRIQGMTIPDASAFVREKLAVYYDDPDANLMLSHINNNKVYVLGRVANPGAVNFSGQGTLLEALSLAGGLPADTRLSFLSRCMIVRGNEMLIWIDLRDLLEKGNLALNTRLQNGDFIFIPQSEDQLAYIMGEVPRPGVIVLRSQMTLLDAVMQSGGPTMNANDGKIYLIRNHAGRGNVEEVDLRAMYTRGDLRRNYVLQDGDIVYVGRSTMGGINAMITQLLPGMRAVDFTINTAEAFGAMAELRNKIWGQEGFINRTSD